MATPTPAQFVIGMGIVLVSGLLALYVAKQRSWYPFGTQTVQHYATAIARLMILAGGIGAIIGAISALLGGW